MTPRDDWLDRSKPPREAHDLKLAVLGPEAVSLIEQMYQAHAAEARSLALAFLGDEHLAQDAVHLAFITILRRVLQGWRGTDDDEARATVLRNTRWAALTQIRKRRRQAEGWRLDETWTDNDRWAESEARLLVERIVAQLRPKYRTALHYRYVEQLPTKDAAAALGMTVKAYTRMLDRAILAARRVAHGTGLSPWAVLAGVLHRPERRTERKSAVRLAWKGTRVVQTAALTALVGTGIGLAHPNTEPHTLQVRSVLGPTPSAATTTATTETIDDTVVVDIAGRTAGDGSAALIALGEGRRCACWVVLETLNGGAVWSAAPAPPIDSSSPRVVVTTAFPSDARIAIVTSTQGTEQVARRFGDPWTTAASGGLAGGRELPRSPCQPAASGRVLCFGQRIPSPPGRSDVLVSSMISLGNGWLVYLSPHGGIACYRTGGSWSPVC